MKDAAAAGGGDLEMIQMRRVSAGLVVVAISVMLLGCAAKKPGVEGGGPGGLGGAPLPGGSLDRFKQGLEASAGGPLQDVNFAYDRYDLSEESRRILQSNADWLKANPATKVEVEGHCDERGTVEYNLALGAKRAKSAKDYMVSLGIAADRLSTISYGEELPLCRESDEACWSRNRRAHFVVLQ